MEAAVDAYDLLVDDVKPLHNASGPFAQVPPRHNIAHSSNAGLNVQTVVRPKHKSRRRKDTESDDPSKRRCVSTACVACRKRKSKCDGNLPACAACSQVYGTECIYDPKSDHRRKGVYKNDVDNLKIRDSTLQTLIQAILNYSEDDIPGLIREIRTCESLDVVAEKVVAKENGADVQGNGQEDGSAFQNYLDEPTTALESHLYGKMGDLQVDEDSMRYIGGTSNLIHLASEDCSTLSADVYAQQEDPITSWTSVTEDADLINHLLNMYFTWHYPFFTTLSKQLFYRDFSLGKPPDNARRSKHYCTPLLVNAMLALGCHFTSHAGARVDPSDPATAGDHFFREAKRLIMENDEHEKPHLTTVQALALMSVREAGCGREAKGWVYSGMSFRMACDMGLNLDSSHLTSVRDEVEEDVRRVTFWGCFLFDKCWSNYLGRLPQLPSSLVTTSKFEVFPEEDSSQWIPYTDSGYAHANAQPARTRVVALQILKLCQISDDLMQYFYNPMDMEKTKGKAAELKKLSDIHTRLETWRRELPGELEPRESCLSSVLVMHMFFQLLFIHLFRPFLRYTQATSPLPSNVSPRKLCSQAAAMISKLMRLYKRSHGLRQIPNIAVYITHSACTIHLLNLPDKNAKRDIVHGVKHLEEIAECWLCARRTLAILSALATKWKVELPKDAATILARTDAKFDMYLSEIHLHSTGNLRRGSADLHTANAPNQGISHVSAKAAAFTGNGHRISHTSTGITRPNSTTFKLPPQDASGLRAQPYPSATPTPTTATAQQPHRWRSSEDGQSPSDMFGGVEQLLRDSQRWAYQDQAQLATELYNWNPPTNTTINDGGANLTQPQAAVAEVPSGSRSLAPGVAQVSPTSPLLHQQQPHGASSVPLDGRTMNWLTDLSACYSIAASYDEDEWYQ